MESHACAVRPPRSVHRAGRRPTSVGSVRPRRRHRGRSGLDSRGPGPTRASRSRGAPPSSVRPCASAPVGPMRSADCSQRGVTDEHATSHSLRPTADANRSTRTTWPTRSLVSLLVHDPDDDSPPSDPRHFDSTSSRDGSPTSTGAMFVCIDASGGPRPGQESKSSPRTTTRATTSAGRRALSTSDCATCSGSDPVSRQDPGAALAARSVAR